MTTETRMYGNVKRQLKRNVTTTDETTGRSTWSCVPDGVQVADIEIEINFDTIRRRVAEKAMANKSGVSRFLNGAVVVRALRRTKVDGEL